MFQGVELPFPGVDRSSFKNHTDFFFFFLPRASQRLFRKAKLPPPRHVPYSLSSMGLQPLSAAGVWALPSLFERRACLAESRTGIFDAEFEGLLSPIIPSSKAEEFFLFPSTSASLEMKSFLVM